MKQGPSPPAEIREYLAYAPETGVFYWTRSPGAGTAAGEEAGARHDHRGYRRITFRRRKYLAHRLAWWFVHGEWPAEIDHIRGTAAGDGIANLRIATRGENLCNTPPRRGRRFKGVQRDKRCGRWIAKISLSVATEEEAARAYDAIARKLHGPFARLNFPGEDED